jgi:hypothetical protein
MHSLVPLHDPVEVVQWISEAQSMSTECVNNFETAGVAHLQ